MEDNKEKGSIACSSCQKSFEENEISYRDKNAFCSFCLQQLWIKDFQKYLESIRKVKCNICQELVLPSKHAFTLFYLIQKGFEEVKKIKIDQEKNPDPWLMEIYDQTICNKCWETNQYLLINKVWVKTIVNPNEILGLVKGQSRIFYFSDKHSDE